jgi:hypothetical protein
MAQDINVTLSNTNPIYLKNQSVDATAIANAAATAYANAVANSVALYQTTAGLSANVLTLTSNNSTNFGGVSLGTIQSQITGNAVTAYSNAVTISATDASNKSDTAYSNAIAKSDTAYSNAIAVAASLYAPLTGSVFTGPVSGITTLIVGNTNITGFVTVDTTLQVFTNTATFGTAAYFVANGNIGLGTSTPNSKLQVTGTANISGAVALGSTLSIAGALSGVTTLAAGNTTITGFANIISDTASIQVGNTTAYFSGNTTGLNPASNTLGSALGNTTARWVITGQGGTFAGTTSFAGLTATGTLLNSGANGNYGSNTAASTYQLGYGATTTGVLKTINLGTGGAAGSTTNVNIGSTLSNTFVTINANTVTYTGAASGITTLAAGNTSLSGSLSLTDRISQTGTVTNAGGYISLTGQLNSTQTGQQNMFTMQSQVSPQGAGALGSLYGLLFLPTIVSSANNITNLNAIFARVDTQNTYTGIIDTVYTIQAGTPSLLGTSPTTINQFTAQNATATNVFGFKSVISSGSNKWNFYGQGTANNYMAGGLGIGTTSLTQPLTVTGNAAISDTVFVTNSVNAASHTVGTDFVANSTGITTTGFANVSTTLQVGTNTATFGTAAYFVANGNIGLGTSTPSQKLEVSGNTVVNGNMGIGSGVSGSASLVVSKNITGGTTSTGISQNGTVQSDATTAARGFFNTLNVANNTTFTINNFYHYGTINGRPTALNTTINSLHGFQADASLVSGVANYGFLGSLPASSAFTITNVSLTSNIVTVTTSAAHNFAPGQTVVVAATTTTSINGSFVILTSPTTTTFTYALVLGDIVSTADTGTSTVSTGRWNTYMLGTAPNYFLGQVTIGSTTLTNGYLAVAGTQSSATSQLYVGGTNSFTGTTPIAIYCNPTLAGTSAMTNAYGFNLVPTGTFAAGATMVTYAGINSNPALNSATTPSNYYGVISQLGFNAAALGGTVTTSAAYVAVAPSFNASTTTNITTYAGFRASGVANGTNQSITNIYAFQGLQATSATSNAYNLYMSGTAKNYLAGNTGIGNTLPDATLAVTGTANVSGIVNFGSTLNVAGQLNTSNSITSLTATSKVNIGTDSGGSISLGRTDGTASAPYIDFNSSATAVDFDARISVGAGNGTVGAATLTIAAGSLAIGNTNVTGALTTSSYVKTTAMAVASLPSAATAGVGARSFVTDSTVAASGNFGAIVAGTGANPVPVYSDGTNWRIG